MRELERRFTDRAAELRANAGNDRTIGGYASVFNRPSSDLGGFTEVVDQRAFNKSKGDGYPGVMARYNHSDMMLLGTTASGTLRLAIDAEGLSYSVDVPQARQDVYELVQRGDIQKSSFAFRTVEDDWSMSDSGFPMRTLVQVQLVDVAPVNTPAYPDASVGLRSLAERCEAELDEVKELAGRNELRKLLTRTDRPTPDAAAKVRRLALLAKRNPQA